MQYVLATLSTSICSRFALEILSQTHSICSRYQKKTRILNQQLFDGVTHLLHQILLAVLEWVQQRLYGGAIPKNGQF